MIKTVIFDWGDTIMRDYPELPGTMCSWAHVEWIPGAKELLESLKDRFDLVVASNSGESNTQDMIDALKRIGADTYFQYFFTSDELKFNKPDKRFFLSIFQRLNILPQESVMIGNNYAKDIVGAKEVDMKTIYFNEKREIGDFAMADITIHKMIDAIPFFAYAK